MRTIQFSKNTYRGEIRTSDLICPAFGNNYLDIAFVQKSQEIPDKVTIEVEGTTLSFTLPVRYSQLATEQLDGAFFNLEWLKYYAPTSGIKSTELSVYADDVLVASVEYKLTAGRGEVELPVHTFEINGVTYNEGDFFRICPAERTKHWSNVEMLAVHDLDNYLLVYVGNGHPETEYNNNGIVSVGYFASGGFEDGFNVILVDQIEGINGIAFRMPIKENYCADIELRITNRHGLRGVIGGKIVDASEGDDDVKSNFNKVTPYAGIYEWSKKGATIKKEVGFNFEGDEGLLGLLRDGCVYGRVEWYDERTEQWLPCRIEEKSIGNNAWDEQIVTIVLQEL